MTPDSAPTVSLWLTGGTETSYTLNAKQTGLTPDEKAKLTDTLRTFIGARISRATPPLAIARLRAALPHVTVTFIEE